ncbi:proteoglycan 4 [Asbolus verrucosus]|uniref:Proteoglycan 4 n=1 Tax=Asbolus verrucosus TaxID=1661398 RepID=A0A482V948_ASBVE|nr:proteoglycan 4 [Asbolus verrucosus]
MNSALKPVLTSTGPQNPPVTTQLNKPMHPQSTPSTYGQPSTHMPQSLVNLPHNNPNVAHSHPNPAHQTNHYSLNVPNAPQHYSSNNPSTIPASNHPVPNVSPAATGGQTYSPNKNVPFSGGYQPNLGHPPNQNPMPPVSQTLPATQPPHHTPAPAETSTEKPQSNGTPEVKSPTKPEPQENHVSLPRDKSPIPPSSPKICEKPEEKTFSALPEQKQQKQESVKVAEESKISLPTPEPASPAVNISPNASTNSPSTETTENASATTGVSEAKTDAGIGSTENSSRESQPDAVESAIAEAAQNVSPPKSKDKEQQKTTPVTKITTPRTPTRKSKTPKPEGDSPKTSKIDTKTPSTQKSPSLVAKSKRTRIKTQPYQSPLPEIEIITKISSSTPRTKTNDDNGLFSDFDCILTNLNLVRVDKGRYRLPPAEKERTDSILKRSLAVEKGEVTSPSLTEEHPDGIDLSLYKEESQLKKRKATKRKAASSLKSNKKSDNTTKSPEQPKVRKVAVKTAKKATSKRTAAVARAKKATAVEVKKPITSSRTDRAKRRSDNQNHNKVSPVVDQKKARVLAKVARKTTANATNRSQSATKSEFYF